MMRARTTTVSLFGREDARRITTIPAFLAMVDSGYQLYEQRLEKEFGGLEALVLAAVGEDGTKRLAAAGLPFSAARHIHMGALKWDASRKSLLPRGSKLLASPPPDHAV